MRIALILAAVCTADLTAQSGPTANQLIRLDPIAGMRPENISELGLVTGAVADGDGHIFILDPTVPRIVVADRHLRPLGHIGRRGSGPGEFREPVAIGVSDDGKVAVLDRALRRLTFFVFREGGQAIRAERTVSLRNPAEGMCLLRDKKFLIYGLTAGMRLHVLDPAGSLVRSFAPADSKLSPMAQNTVTKGKIACDLQRDEVLVSSRFLPIVEAFRISTGQRVWVDTLRPFRAIVVTDGGTRVSIASGRSGFSLITSLFSFGDYRVFQAVYSSRLDTVATDTVTSYLYSRSAQRWLIPHHQAPILFPLTDASVLTVRTDDPLEVRISRLMVDSGSAKAARVVPR